MKALQTPEELRELMKRLSVSNWDDINLRQSNNIRSGTIVRISEGSGLVDVRLSGTSRVLPNIRVVSNTIISVGQPGLVFGDDPYIASNQVFIPIGPPKDATNSSSRIALSGDQSITANTITKVDFDKRLRDTNNDFDLTSSDFTAPVSGDYLVISGAKTQIGADQDRIRLFIYVDGVEIVQAQNNASGASNQQVRVMDIVGMDTGAVLDIRINNIDSNDTIVAADSNTYVSIKLLN